MAMEKIIVEVVKYALIYIAEEMGVILRKTAFSPNIRDRLDFSCAILAPSGDLVAQAEHIPVHLGSMVVGAKNIIKWINEHEMDLEAGDIILSNDPYIVGTHLNDVMLLKPVFYKDEIVAYLVNKAHHVDIGGKVPGSISVDAESLYEEGIVIEPIKIVEKNIVRKDLLRKIMTNIRTPEYFKGDIMAQIASLKTGETRLMELISKYGHEVLYKSYNEIIGYTERYTRNVLEKLISRYNADGEYTATDYLESRKHGLLKINVRIVLAKDNILVDYSGSSMQVKEPLNAVYGVTVAATTYALKTIIDPDMPMNQGFYRVVSINAPKGSILNPKPPAPVAGGNLETSQRIVDVVHLALSKAFPNRVPAASCGTMTNVLLGGSNWAFYETIGCGSGARPFSDGVDGVHTNMTNTLNTPIEIAEREYPILFIAYELRRDSCGPGRYRGGLGITRAFKVLEDNVVLTIFSEREKLRPWGLAGGGSGVPSKHYIVRGNNVIYIGSKSTVVLKRNDIVYINTPGGGGYGDPCDRDNESIKRDLVEDRISLEYVKENYGYCMDKTIL